MAVESLRTAPATFAGDGGGLNIVVAPLTVQIDGKQYRDRIELPRRNFMKSCAPPMKFPLPAR
jgi:fatty acid-binding protein DegV